MQIARGYAFEQMLQLIDLTQLAFQHECPFPHFDLHVILPFRSCLLSPFFGIRMAKLLPKIESGGALSQINHSGQILEIRIARDHFSLLIFGGRVHNCIGHCQAMP